MINIDTFIEIGSSHKVCEDYIISGYDPFPYIILSDGCSSSDNSDMGARILCYLAKQYLSYRKDHYPVGLLKMGSWIIHNAELVARQLGLRMSCLDATLIVAYELDNHIYVYMYGDGCVVIKDGDEFEIIQIEYIDPVTKLNRNAPYYLSYTIDQDRDDIYKQMLLQKGTIRLNKDGEFLGYESDYSTPNFFVYSDLKNIAISSDGLLSFIKNDKGKITPLNKLDVVKSLLGFKTVNGKCLQRRCTKQMKDFSKENISHFDDLSIGIFMKE